MPIGVVGNDDQNLNAKSYFEMVLSKTQEGQKYLYTRTHELKSQLPCGIKVSDILNTDGENLSSWG